MDTQLKPSDHPGESFVTVYLDGIANEIHRGSHTGAQLKHLLGVDPTYELDQDINGKLTPITDTDRVTIKGGEQFFAHVRSGGSSR